MTSSFYNSDRFCYSTIEAYMAMGISRSKLFKLLARGEIKARKLGARTVISASELTRYLDSLPEVQFHAHAEKRG